MNAAELTATLHRLIPLTAAMEARVALLTDEELVLRAPLARNHNHAGSAFAGSIAALASVAGWAFLHQLAQREQLPVELLLADGHVRYRRPLRGELEARAYLPQAEQARFVAALRAGGKARLRLTIPLPADGEPAAEFEGLYVGLPAPVLPPPD